MDIISDEVIHYQIPDVRGLSHGLKCQYYYLIRWTSQMTAGAWGPQG